MLEHEDSLGRVRRLSPRQRENVAANLRAGKPIFTSPTQTTRDKPVRKIAFISPHCVVDFSNGAATVTRDALRLLAGEGFECQVFCGTQMDQWEEGLAEKSLSRQGIKYEVGKARIGPHENRMIFTLDGTVPLTLFDNSSTRGGWRNIEEARPFLGGCELFLRKNRPDVVWSFGGDPVCHAVHSVAKRLDIPVLVALHNSAYRDQNLFCAADQVFVPSEFARRLYWEQLGLACQILPSVVDGKRVEVAKRRPKFLTFVNPELAKGVLVFARIAEVLSRRRPDILLLVVPGGSRFDALQMTGIDTNRLGNVRIMERTHDPRQFYAETKLLLMPSLGWNHLA